MPNVYKYTIIDDADVTQAKIDACIETDSTTIRQSSDARCVLKWFDSAGVPPELGSVTEYTATEIKAEMQQAAWIDED